MGIVLRKVEDASYPQRFRVGIGKEDSTRDHLSPSNDACGDTIEGSLQGSRIRSACCYLRERCFPEMSPPDSLISRNIPAYSFSAPAFKITCVYSISRSSPLGLRIVAAPRPVPLSISRRIWPTASRLRGGTTTSPLSPTSASGGIPRISHPASFM